MGNNTDTPVSTLSNEVDITSQKLAWGKVLTDAIENITTDYKTISHALMLSNSFNRYDTFKRIEEKYLLSNGLTPSNYCKAFKEAYSDSDNLHNHKDHIKGVIEYIEKNIKSYQSFIMSPDELTYISTLPDQITVYRGLSISEHKNKDYGISWTLSKDVAIFFAKEYRRNLNTTHDKNIVVSCTIDKGDILFYDDGREEKEIVIKSSSLGHIKATEV